MRSTVWTTISLIPAALNDRLAVPWPEHHRMKRWEGAWQNRPLWQQRFSRMLHFTQGSSVTEHLLQLPNSSTKHCCIPGAQGKKHLITDIYPTSQSHKYPISTGLAKQQILNSDQHPWDKIAQSSKSTQRKSLKAHVKTSHFRAQKKLTYKCQKGNE